MGKWLAFIIFLISSITITGVSFIDGKIWDIVFYIVGLIAYGIVGLLFSIGLLSTKNQGSEAYIIVFILLIACGFAVYKLLVAIRKWILSWPLFVKILVPSLIITSILVVAFFIVRDIVKVRKEEKNI